MTLNRVATNGHSYDAHSRSFGVRREHTQENLAVLIVSYIDIEMQLVLLIFLRENACDRIRRAKCCGYFRYPC